jgi:hypothetical protein
MKAHLRRVARISPAKRIGATAEIESILSAGLPEGPCVSDPANEHQQALYWQAFFQRYTLEELVSESMPPE